MTTIHILIWLNLIYYICLQALYILLVLLSARQLRQYNRSITFGEFRRIAQSELTTPVSLIIPAYNEALIIVNTVRNAFALNFPRYEVIVVNDGSTDEMMSVLIKAFNLRRVDRHDPKYIATKEVLGVYQSPDHPKLVVVDKKNGQRADAINAGQNFSSHPLLCVIDADCVLEEDVLLHLVRPFLRDPDVTAVAGIVRPSNGLTVENGKIIQRGLPQSLLGMSQEVEYARSFQWARMGLCRLKSMLCISGALMMIRKSIFQELGGSSPSAITDDMEFTVRLNAHVYDRRKTQRAKLMFLPGAICYTEIPETFTQYASQRNRWQRGTLQALVRNWWMFLNPRYGLTGLFGVPFFVLFDSLASIVEISAWILMVVVLVLGVATVWQILLALYVAYIVNVFLSLSAILLTETSRLRTTSWNNLWKILFAIFLENLGFHQFHLIVRLVGGFEYLFRGRRDLGMTMERIVPNPSTL